MSRKIDRAIDAYKAAITPEGVREFKELAKKVGAESRITATEIRISLAMEMRDVLDAEINRLS
jgi:hypothetical protein